jgi:hypothetical protein
MPAPADQSKNPNKPDQLKPANKPHRPPRRKNRFNEREFARAVRAGRAAGAHRVTLDPATGIYTIDIDKPDGGTAGTDLDRWMRDKNARPT